MPNIVGPSVAMLILVPAYRRSRRRWSTSTQKSFTQHGESENPCYSFLLVPNALTAQNWTHCHRLGNKAIYRTRMAMATGGELVVLAPGMWHTCIDMRLHIRTMTAFFPGVERFGEDLGIDALLRKCKWRLRQIALDRQHVIAWLACM
eukprot:COSAG05_NODE_1943_length_3799_cov_21.288649_2_plen_148_part_00